MAKKHDLIFEVAISDVKYYLSLIRLSYPHLMIKTSEAQLGKSAGTT